MSKSQKKTTAKQNNEDKQKHMKHMKKLWKSSDS